MHLFQEPIPCSLFDFSIRGSLRMKGTPLQKDYTFCWLRRWASEAGPFHQLLGRENCQVLGESSCGELRGGVEKFVFNVGMHLIWRDVEPGSEEMDQIRNEISRVAEALLILPINFPGFSFHKALKTRQVLVSRIQSEISRRRKAGIQQDDVLNALMSIREVEVLDYDICCMMVGIMFAASSTNAALIPWVLKYLDNFAEVRQRVQEEQDCLRQKMIEDKSLTWFKAKSSMPYTLQVIYEIMRIESLALLILRQANKDVDYNGKGSFLRFVLTCSYVVKLVTLEKGSKPTIEAT